MALLKIIGIFDVRSLLDYYEVQLILPFFGLYAWLGLCALSYPTASSIEWYVCEYRSFG